LEASVTASVWKLQDAKARFSEVVRRARSDGPQHVTVHGREEVVVISAGDYARLAGENTRAEAKPKTGMALVEALQDLRLRGFSYEREVVKSPVRPSPTFDD
jgi:prevent-host-death family protein